MIRALKINYNLRVYIGKPIEPTAKIKTDTILKIKNSSGEVSSIFASECKIFDTFFNNN